MNDRFAESAADGRPPANELVIDLHGHCGASSGGAKYWPCTSADLLAAAEKVGVARLVFSSLDALGATAEADFAAAGAAAAATVASVRSAPYLSAYHVLHPHFPAATLRHLRQAGAAFVGAKLHGELHDTRIGHPVLQPFFTVCEERSFTVLLHVHPSDAISDVAEIASRFPKLNFILAHLRPTPEEAAKIFPERPNLYTDTSLSRGRPGAIERMVRAVGADRVVYGSDSTYLSMGGQFAKLALADLPPNEKRLIFGGNASRVVPLLASLPA